MGGTGEGGLGRTGGNGEGRLGRTGSNDEGGLGRTECRVVKRKAPGHQ